MGGGSTAAAVTLDTVAAESRKKMADGVTRSPARLRCCRVGKRYYYERLEYDFVLFIVPCFLLFIISPALSRYVYLLRFPSSVKQQSATVLSARILEYAFFLVSFASCLISDFFSFRVVIN